MYVVAAASPNVPCSYPPTIIFLSKLNWTRIERDLLIWTALFSFPTVQDAWTPSAKFNRWRKSSTGRNGTDGNYDVCRGIMLSNRGDVWAAVSSEFPRPAALPWTLWGAYSFISLELRETEAGTDGNFAAKWNMKGIKISLPIIFISPLQLHRDPVKHTSLTSRGYLLLRTTACAI